MFCERRVRERDYDMKASQVSQGQLRRTHTRTQGKSNAYPDEGDSAMAHGAGDLVHGLGDDVGSCVGGGFEDVLDAE